MSPVCETSLLFSLKTINTQTCHARAHITSSGAESHWYCNQSIGVSFALEFKGKLKHRPPSKEMKRIERQTLPSDARSCYVIIAVFRATSVSTKEIIHLG